MIELNQRYLDLFVELGLVLEAVEVLCVLILSSHELLDEVFDSWLHELDLILLEQLLYDSHEFDVLICFYVLLRAEEVPLEVDQLFAAEVLGRLKEVEAEQAEAFVERHAALVDCLVFGVLPDLLSHLLHHSSL